MTVLRSCNRSHYLRHRPGLSCGTLSLTRGLAGASTRPALSIPYTGLSTAETRDRGTRRLWGRLARIALVIACASLGACSTPAVLHAAVKASPSTSVPACVSQSSSLGSDGLRVSVTSTWRERLCTGKITAKGKFPSNFLGWQNSPDGICPTDLWRESRRNESFAPNRLSKDGGDRRPALLDIDCLFWRRSLEELAGLATRNDPEAVFAMATIRLFGSADICLTADRHIQDFDAVYAATTVNSHTSLRGAAAMLAGQVLEACGKQSSALDHYHNASKLGFPGAEASINFLLQERDGVQ